jgi:type IV pilus assembly protein PilV
LLGLAALQATSLGNNQSAYYRSQATQLAYDIADRMRSNSADAKLAVDTDAATVSSYLGSATKVASCSSSPGCTPANMAKNDLFEWISNLQATLPGSTGVVCLDSTPNDGTPAAPACNNLGTLFAIKIWWNDDKTGTPFRFWTSFML